MVVDIWRIQSLLLLEIQNSERFLWFRFLEICILKILFEALRGSMRHFRRFMLIIKKIFLLQQPNFSQLWRRLRGWKFLIMRQLIFLDLKK